MNFAAMTTDAVIEIFQKHLEYNWKKKNVDLVKEDISSFSEEQKIERRNLFKKHLEYNFKKRFADDLANI